MNSPLGREVSSPGRRGYPGEAERRGEEKGTNGNPCPPRSAEARSTSALSSRAPPSNGRRGPTARRGHALPFLLVLGLQSDGRDSQSEREMQ